MLHCDDITDNVYANGESPSVQRNRRRNSSDTDSNMLTCRRCELVLGCSEGIEYSHQETRSCSTSILFIGDGVVKFWKHRLAAPINNSSFSNKGGIFSRYTAVAPIAAQILYFAQAQGCFNFELCVEADAQANRKADANVHSGSDDWLLHASNVLTIRTVVPRKA